MPESNNSKISPSEKRDLVIQAGMQSIPYVGSQLATIYFGIKQELRFKRIETFCKEIKEEVLGLEDKIAPPEDHDKESLAAIIEELLEKVEREQSQEKIEFLKNYFKNTLIHPVKDNYDERRFFLDTLSTMTLLECQVLVNLYQQTKEVEIDSIKNASVDNHVTLGALNRLKAYGFVSSRQFGIADSDFVQIYSNQELYAISEYGKRFCEFCLEVD